MGQLILTFLFFLVLLTFRAEGPLLNSEEKGGYKSFESRLPAFSFLDLGSQAETRADFEKNSFPEINLEAKSVYVVDLLKDEVLYQRNQFESRPLASLTKLWTVLLLEERLPPGIFIPFSLEAIRQEGDDGFLAGEKFKKEDLADIIMTASSNDASYAVAEFIGVSEFVNLMNQRSVELGLAASFLTPHGLDVESNGSEAAGGAGNAFEVSRIFEYLFENHPRLLEKTRFSEFSITSEAGRIVRAKNTNKALGNIPQLLGAKTGFTNLAGGNLVFVFDAGFSHPVLVTILGSSAEGRFEDAQKIVQAALESGIRN